MTDNSFNTIKFYLGELKKFPLLSREEEVALGRDIQSGSVEARNKMVEHNLRLVIGVARKWQGRGLPLEDLISEGNIGLIKATENFDPDRGFRFSTMAYYWVKQAVDRAICNQAGMIRLPVGANANLKKLRKAQQELMERSDEEPTREELVEKTEFQPKKVEQLLGIDVRAYSLDTPLKEGDDYSLSDMIEDHSPSAQDVAEAAETGREVGSWVDKLKDSEQEVVRLRFGLDGEGGKTLDEVGQVLGVTRERVRQIEVVALKKLKAVAEDRPMVGPKPPRKKYTYQNKERAMARRKVDLAGLHCEDCGNPATEVKQFNLKYNRCQYCAGKYTAALEKVELPEPEVKPKEDMVLHADPENHGNESPRPFIPINFCPNCGQNLCLQGSLERIVTYIGHKENNGFECDGGSSFGAYSCNNCKMRLVEMGHDIGEAS